MRERLRQTVHALWPRFWDARSTDDRCYTFSDYPRTWALTIAVLLAAAFIPLGTSMLIDHGLSRRKVELEHALRIERLASNAKRSVAHFLKERLDALRFTVQEVEFEKLTDSEHLAVLLQNLKLGFGGVTDLGVIDRDGHQIAYSGPYDLKGRDYSTHDSFLECSAHGAHVSGVFRGYRDEPHFVISVCFKPPGESSHILRATLDIQRLTRTLESLKTDVEDDIFLVNHSAILQTASRGYGDILEVSGLHVPSHQTKTRSLATVDPFGKPVLIAYSSIRTDIGRTPFVLMYVRDAAHVEAVIADLRWAQIRFFALSALGILLAVVFTLTYMFNRLYEADQSKARSILDLEQTTRLASLGRLAAGVAHEINNPLAVINEDAGYIRDLLTFTSVDHTDEELLEHIGSIIESVDRCRRITRQLLGFSRKVEVRIECVQIQDVIEAVLGFHRKEAEHRTIAIDVDASPDAREIVTDRGRLQQVLLNIVSNAFQAMADGGRLGVTVRPEPADRVSIAVSDTGPGIPPGQIEQIFEPFFTTKDEGQGTGLGLAISYGLVKKLNGELTVTSEIGRGSTFRVELPIWSEAEAEGRDEATAGG